MPAFDASILREEWEGDGRGRSGPACQDIAVGKQSWPSVKSGFLQIKWAIWLTRSLEIEPKKAPEDKTFPGLESYRP